MSFDPGIAAHLAFDKARESAELGGELEAAVAAEERFSSGVGEDASAAYRELVEIGARHPGASFFTEFLIYATWCHLMDETVPEHFRRGLALCRRLLGRLGPGGDAERLARLRSIEQSFRAGLGGEPEELTDYDADTLKGGD